MMNMSIEAVAGTRVLNRNDRDQAVGGKTPARKIPMETKRLKRALTEEEMARVTGGYWLLNPCVHEWVYSGRSKEESFFIFWTHTVYERTCRKCNSTSWA